MTSIAGMSLSPTMHLEGTRPSLGLSERLLALLPWDEGGGWQRRCPSLFLSVTQTVAGPLMASSPRAFYPTSSFLFVSSRVFKYSCFPSLLLFSSPLVSFLSPCLSLSTCLADFAAVVRSSAGGHAGFPGGQAARRQPATPSQPGYTLPTHQHTPTEWQEPQLPTTEQD